MSLVSSRRVRMGPPIFSTFCTFLLNNVSVGSSPNVVNLILHLFVKIMEPMHIAIKKTQD